jgi:hypothetical protein
VQEDRAARAGDRRGKIVADDDEEIVDFVLAPKPLNTDIFSYRRSLICSHAILKLRVDSVILALSYRDWGQKSAATAKSTGTFPRPKKARNCARNGVEALTFASRQGVWPGRHPRSPQLADRLAPQCERRRARGGLARREGRVQARQVVRASACLRRPRRRPVIAALRRLQPSASRK